MDTNRILAELRSERDRIDQAISALEALDSFPARGSRKFTGKSRRGGRRHMSAAARKRISEMMKKRWAERKRREKA
jgi:hypothetical protein